MKLSKILSSLIVAFLPILSSEAAPKNILLICVDDLRPELNSFGADYILSPNIDALAATGRAFTRHYVNASSCGPSRYTLLTGRYGPSHNGALVERAKRMASNANSVPPSMPEWFRKNGYTTISVGKVSHHPGGLYGQDWNDPDKVEMPGAWDQHIMPSAEWKHPLGAMHGLAHGNIREKASEHPVYEAVEGPNEIYPDGPIANEGIRQIKNLSRSDKPFFLAVGLIRPHLPFGAPKRFLDLYEGIELPPIPHPEKPAGLSTWHRSGEFRQYQRWGKNPNADPEFADALRRHYAACVSYVDEHVGMLIEALETAGLRENTVIVLWGDHGFHLGEHAIWGKHSLYEESLLSPLIIAKPNMTEPGEKAHGIVETTDIFPTLCELVGIEVPEFVHGTSLLRFLNNPSAMGDPAIGYLQNAGRTIRTDRYRLILHKNGAVELYDHQNDPDETINVAENNSKVVESLKAELLTQLSKP